MGLQDYINQNEATRGQGMNILAAITPQIGEPVIQVTLDKLSPFNGHTFQVNEDAPDFGALKQGIEDMGIQSPLLVRPSPAGIGHYEIIAGHRRHRIAQLLELPTVPCISRPCDDDTAIQLMGVSNVQRPDWLPSEKAKTYKAHLEATQRKSGIKAGRPTAENNSPTRLANYRNDDEAAKVWGVSGEALRMYIKLNNLLPNLLQYTDEGRIVVKAAYQMSFLSSDHQEVVEKILTKYPKKKISAVKAKEIREIANEGALVELDVLRVLGMAKKEETKELPINVTLYSSTILNKKTVKSLMEEADVLLAIEDVLVAYAEKHGLPLD